MLNKNKKSSGGHWGVFYVSDSPAGKLVAEPHPRDPNPTKLIDSSVAASQHLDSRVIAPMVRKGWLDNGPTGTGRGRGGEAFVQVSSDLLQVYYESSHNNTKGRESIYQISQCPSIILLFCCFQKSRYS